MSKLPRTLSAACSFGLLLGAAAISSPADAHVAGADPRSPRLQFEWHDLLSMTAGSADDVWAVGSAFDDNFSPAVGLAEHWDGTGWQRVHTPGGDAVELDGVSEIASDDVWAVGVTGPLGAQQPLILHWDGTRWSVVPGAPQVTQGWLAAVDAISSDDIWAVGFGNGAALVEHWDGLEWSVVRTPSHFGSGSLSSVTFSSPSDGWVLRADCGSGQPSCPAVAAHWDGSRWQKTSLPNQAEVFYTSVVTLSPTDAWAVGMDLTGRYKHTQLAAAHWDGSAWTAVALPQVGRGELRTVVAARSGDVWAFGQSRVGRDWLPLAAHFDGSDWTLSDMPKGRAAHTFLHGAVAIGAKDVWADGATGKTTFLSHWNGTRWS